MIVHRQPMWAVVLLVALAMRIASTATVEMSYIVVASYALLGRAQVIQALAVSWLFTMLSPGIAAEATGASVGRYAVLLCAAVSVFLRSRMFRRGIRIRPVTMSTLLLGVFFVVHSWLFSPMVDVSVLKAVSWTLAMSTLIGAWVGLVAAEREALAKQIFSALMVLMLVSLPLLASPLGYLRNETGFQGVLNHPQAFGPTMALLGAWAAGRIVGDERPSWSVLAVVAACVVLVVLSETRTAGLAMVLGVGIAVILAPILAGKSVGTVMPGLRSKRIHLVGAMSLVGLVLMGTKLDGIVTVYISKGGRAEADTLAAAYEGSRGGVMDNMWANIEDKPFQGIGFGLASVPEEMEVERDPVLGLPVGAAIEKGVLPLVVWEEVGLVGFVAVAAWVLMLLRESSSGGVAPVAVGLTALLLNMGESTLFSPGGLGLLSMVLLGWAFACGQGKGRAR
jgi:hypothetical protein